MAYKIRLSIITVFITLSFFVLSGKVCAQPPFNEKVSSEAERFRKNAEEKRKELERKKAKAPETELEKEKEKPAVKMPSFVLKQIDITGVTVFKPKDFHPYLIIYQKYIGKEVTFEDLQAIVEIIKDQYKEKGYYTTIVYIPEQEIKDGNLKISVVEGKMGKLKVEGNKWFSKSFISRQFHIIENEVLNFKKLQKDILRLNRNPDLTVQAVIAPGETPGTSDIVLKAADKFPWHIGAGADDLGSRMSGQTQYSMTLRSSNVTGIGDTLYGCMLFARGASGEYIGYNMPLNTYGTRLGLDVTRFHIKLGKELATYDVTGSSQIYSPYISHEVYFSDTLSASVTAGMDIKSFKTRKEGAVEVKDELRIPFFGFNLTEIDSFAGGGQTSFTPKFSFGTDGFLGASSRNNSLAGRPGSDGFFFKYTQNLRRIQKMIFDSYIDVRSQLQVSSRSLPSSEQLQLGGVYSVRGYPEGDYLADTGAILNIDWIFPMYLIPKSWKMPNSNVPLRHQIEPIAFVDIGGGKLKKTLPGEEESKFLLGVGGGVRIRIYDNIFCRFEWAKHLGDKPVGGAGSSTFRFVIQTEM